MYGVTQLRRLAFLQIAHQLGLLLATAGAILDAASPRWRHAAREQLAELDRTIDRARTAQALLSSAVDCPAEHPTSECPVMIEALDRLLAGATITDLAPQRP